MQIMFIFVAIIYAFWYCFHAMPYYFSTYYRDKRRFFLPVFWDKGAYGEYLIYDRLRRYEEDGARFLFNVYLPKKEKETSEIDVIMIHASGIYVFESKNYSGWIFGSEKNRTWTQCLPQGRRSRKEKFYNPIMQNRAHVKWLKSQIGSSELIRNIVVFSERCTLKQIDVTSKDVTVVKRDFLPRLVNIMNGSREHQISESRQNEIYKQLLPFTQVSAETKKAHVDKIVNTYKK